MNIVAVLLKALPLTEICKSRAVERVKRSGFRDKNAATSRFGRRRDDACRSTSDELMKLFYAARPCRRHQPAVASISSTSAVGSGTVALALATAPLPVVWPKLARHVL